MGERVWMEDRSIFGNYIVKAYVHSTYYEDAWGVATEQATRWMRLFDEIIDNNTVIIYNQKEAILVKEAGPSPLLLEYKIIIYIDNCYCFKSLCDSA